jgi:thiol-disulfide isomerase/thioredoxin
MASCFSATPQKTGKEGKPMPEFKLLLTDSTTWISTQATDNRATVLFVFSPFCPYCKTQTKVIIENMDKLKDIQFYFITNFPIATLKDYNKEFQLGKYPNIIAGIDATKSVGDYFEIIGVPYMAIFGKDQKLHKSFLGGKLYSSQIKKIAEE